MALEEGRRVTAHVAPAGIISDRWRQRGRRWSIELTGRELEVLRELVRGHTNQHIADQLGVSAKT